MIAATSRSGRQAANGMSDVRVEITLPPEVIEALVAEVAERVPASLRRQAEQATYMTVPEAATTRAARGS